MGKWAGAGTLAVAIAVAALACADRPTGPLAVRDSAGITIVESSAPRWPADSAPVVADSPLVDIGVFRELSGALRLSDGRIVVTTVNPPTLRFYSATGQSLYNAGGPEDGATALTSAYSLSRGRGDTLAVYDFARRRVVRFDANGAGISALQVSNALMPAGSNGYLPRGLSPDGRFLLQREEVPYPFPGEEWEVRPDSTRIFWLDQRGQLTDSTPRLLAGEIFGLSIPAIGTPLRLPLARPFAPALRVVPGPALVWTGNGLSWELQGWDGTGVVRRIVRIAHTRDSLTPAFRDTFIARYQERHPLSGPPTLRFYSATGQSLYNAGGPEDGATALSSAYSLSRGRGDTLAVYDFARRRVVRFDANGAGISALQVSDALMPAGSNGYLPRGLSPDGRFLLQREEVPYPFPGEEWEVRPDSTRIFWFDQRGQLTDSTPRLLAGEIFGLSIPAIGTPLRLPLARPFAPAIRVAVGPVLVWTGNGLSWELQGWDGAGAVRRIVRIAHTRDSLTPAFRDTFIARYQERHPLSGPPTLQSGFANLLPRAPYPSHLPAFAEVIAGADSTIWVQRSGHLEGLPGDRTLQWTVLGPDGAWLGDLTMPAGFRPTDVGRDWVLGLRNVEGRGVRVQLLSLVPR